MTVGLGPLAPGFGRAHGPGTGAHGPRPAGPGPQGLRVQKQPDLVVHIDGPHLSANGTA